VFTVSDRDLTEAEAEKPACAADPNKKVRVAVVMDFYLH
jgi:hypothetical protein